MDTDFIDYIPQIFFGMFISGIIGAVIGSTRNNAASGFFLGALLGPIGWLLAFVVDRRPVCPACKGHVPEGAAKCMHCASDIPVRIRHSQNYNSNFNPTIFESRHSDNSNTLEDYKRWKQDKGIES